MLMESYNELFINEFHKSQEIDEKFSQLNNTIGLKKAMSYLEEMGAFTLDINDYISNYQIKYRISEWTKDTLSDNEKLEFLNELKALKRYIIDISIKINSKLNLPELIIKTMMGDIRVIQYSKINPAIKDLFPFILDNRRYGKCYDFAYEISSNLNIPNKIVTGYIYGYSVKSQFLHSWVEVNIKGEEYVIDGTLNAVINKRGYYLLEHAKPISIISSLTLKNDLETYAEKINLVPLDVYLVFRDEIVKDLERNKIMFKK